MAKRAPHQFTWRVLAWWACARCGLLRIRNARTDAAVARGCEVDG